jgi:cellobiose phosphorylase
MGFYEKLLPYADKGEDTVLGHMKQSLCFNLERMGAHGLPCGLYADWNDCLQLGHKGESLFVAFQLRYALDTYIDICRRLDKTEEVKWAKAHLETLDKNIDQYGWDGQWYRRAYRYDGLTFGCKENAEGFIFLNPQSWAIISGHASGEKAESAMQAVREHLAAPYGIMLCDPFEKTDFTVIKATLYNKSMKENGSIFCHTQGWAIIAETLLGNGDRAYHYLRSFLPAAYNDRAEIRQVEPYVYCQSTHGKYSPRFGASRLPWLTGTAAWSYYATMHYLLGIQPDYDGLRINPCIPCQWKTFSVRRVFRNKILKIRVINETGIQKGVKKILLNGKTIDGNFIPFNNMQEENNVQVFMGR